MHKEVDSVYPVYILIFIQVRQLPVEKSSWFTVYSSTLSLLCKLPLKHMGKTLCLEKV